MTSTPLPTRLETPRLVLTPEVDDDAPWFADLLKARGAGVVKEPELAYELLPRFHGHGYATEASGALLTAAFGTGRTRLWSTVRSWNVASLRVLDKLGFRRDHSTWDTDGEIVWLVRDA